MDGDEGPDEGRDCDFEKHSVVPQSPRESPRQQLQTEEKLLFLPQRLHQSAVVVVVVVLSLLFFLLVDVVIFVVVN